MKKSANVKRSWSHGWIQIYTDGVCVQLTSMSSRSSVGPSERDLGQSGELRFALLGTCLKLWSPWETALYIPKDPTKRGQHGGRAILHPPSFDL